MLYHMGSTDSWARDQIHVPCMEAQSLNRTGSCNLQASLSLIFLNFLILEIQKSNTLNAYSRTEALAPQQFQNFTQLLCQVSVPRETVFY